MWLSTNTVFHKMYKTKLSVLCSLCSKQSLGGRWIIQFDEQIYRWKEKLMTDDRRQMDRLIDDIIKSRQMIDIQKDRQMGNRQKVLWQMIDNKR